MAIDTKDRILDVAERLFGERGFPATSLRDITTGAGVNLASVNYHFGSKNALLAAVLERCLEPINRERLEMLDRVQAQAGGAPPDLEAVIRAFLSPPFHSLRVWGDGEQGFLRLAGRVHSETNEDFRATFVKQFEEVIRRFTAALQRALPHLDEADVNWRVLFMIGSMAFTMSWAPTLVERGSDGGRDPEDVLESLVLYAAAGMAAPVPVGMPAAVAVAGGRA
jgi:AcrR family transcriptional regulator